MKLLDWSLYCCDYVRVISLHRLNVLLIRAIKIKYLGQNHKNNQWVVEKVHRDWIEEINVTHKILEMVKFFVGKKWWIFRQVAKIITDKKLMPTKIITGKVFTDKVSRTFATLRVRKTNNLSYPWFWRWLFYWKEVRFMWRLQRRI